MTVLPTPIDEKQNFGKASISPFWRTRNLEEGENVMVRRLGPGCPGEFRGIIRGIYGGSEDSPDAYIVEMIDRMPKQTFSNVVFPRGCVDAIELTIDDRRSSSLLPTA